MKVKADQKRTGSRLRMLYAPLFLVVCMGLARSRYLTNVNEASLAAKSDEKMVVHSPELVWIMAYPNSGTTYTLALMEQVTDYSMATNYQGDVLQPVPNVPIYQDQPQGPFWRGLSLKPLPNTSVLVKTHCAGYKEDPAEIYDLSLDKFIRGCGRTTIFGRSNNKFDGWYGVDDLHKAVHVVRSPFDNLIARFNNYLFKQTRRNKRPYEKGREGFRAFCRDRDADFAKKYRNSNMSKELSELAERTICHDNAIAYVLWHNHAFEARDQLKLNTLQIRYEDYEDKFNATLSELLSFLELPNHGKTLAFSPSHAYDAYYTKSDRENVKALMKHLASKRTWEAIEQYFG